MELDPRGTALFIEALHFAAEKHKYQKRKGQNPPPYINHPIKVVRTLWEEGNVRNSDVLIVALLHDTIEDTATLPEELSQRFGDRICNAVLEVTNDWSIPKEQLKQKQIDDAPFKSAIAKQVKLADLICNIRDIQEDPPFRWTQTRRMGYLLWAEQVAQGLRGCNPDLDACFAAGIAKAKAAIHNS